MKNILDFLFEYVLLIFSGGCGCIMLGIAFIVPFVLIFTFNHATVGLLFIFFVSFPIVWFSKHGRF